MSYIVLYLPNLTDLKVQIELNPEILKNYMKFEGFNGSWESTQYLREKIKEFSKNNSKE